MSKALDLTGQRFGRLVVVDRAENNRHGETRWRCRCDCGNETVVRAHGLLRTGGTKSCGCLTREVAARSKAKNLTGQRFGRLFVVEKVGKNKTGRSLWRCRCDCGNFVTVQTTCLTMGQTKSCGCLQRDSARERLFKDGRSRTLLYGVFHSIKARCENPNATAFKDYGDRGIKLCPEWHNFAVFKEWALSNGYKKGLTIERIDVNGDYCPNNCTWIPRAEQARNKRTVHLITAFGETKCMADWVRDSRCSVSYATLKVRVNNLGWDVERAIVEPCHGVSNKRVNPITVFSGGCCNESLS